MNILELEQEYLSGKINIGKVMLFYLSMKNKEIVLSLKRLKEKTPKYKLLNDMLKEKEWDNLEKEVSKYLIKYINKRDKI